MCRHYLTLNTKINGPHEIFINDFLVVKYLDDGTYDQFTSINDLLRSSGNNITVKLFPKKGRRFIAADMQQYFHVELVQSNSMIFKNHKKILELSCPIIKEQPFYTISETFFIDKDVLLADGWFSSVKLEKDNLEKEVEDFYTSTYNVLNNGSWPSFRESISARTADVLKSYGNDPEIVKEQAEMQARVLAAKGRMKRIDYSKYRLKIFGNGRLVTLEDENGDSPLYYSTDEFDDFFGIILHRPKEGGSLEIIR